MSKHDDYLTLWKAQSPAPAHDLYTDADEDRPEAICDRNGQVVLSLCKRCGKGEAELEGGCKNQAPAVQDGLTDEQRIDWLCEEAVYTCGQWQVVFDSDKESFIDAVDELAARAHGISLVPVQPMGGV